MPIVTYPDDPEIWSESLSPPEGHWFSGVYGGSVHRDTVYKASGEASIRHEGGTLFGELIFELNQPFDVTNKQNAKITFLHRVGATLPGSSYVRLYNPDGVYAQRSFGTAPGGPFELKEWGVGSGTGWEVHPLGSTFDWTKIKHISILCDGSDSFWVDLIYFSWLVTLPTLKIISQPTGKHFSLDSAVSGYTPAQYQVNPDVTYTISIDPTGFKKWEDGSTNPTRNIVLTAGEVKTITAYYEGAPPPPDEELMPLLLVGVGLVVAIPLVLVLLE